MTTTVLAVYENGVFRPTQPVPLKEGETVQLIVTRPGVPYSRYDDESLLEPLGRIERQLEREMPRLRELYPNMWIAYGATGLLLPPQEEMEELYRQCQERGFSIDDYVLETTAPPPPTITTDAIL